MNSIKKLLMLTVGIMVISVGCTTEPEGFNDFYGGVEDDGSTSSIKEHPRLLFTAEDQAALIEESKSNEDVKALVAKLKEVADKDVQLEKLDQDTSGGDAMLKVSREYLRRLINLSLAHRVISSEDYIGKIDELLLYLCDSEEHANWDPVDHYLDVAEMTLGVSIAYDWCYNDLPEATRKSVEEALYSQAISPAIKEYTTGGSDSWAWRDTNWNVVCNSCMVVGALAVQDLYPNPAEQIISNAVKYVPNCMEYFAPDGVCYEGPMYWDYTVAFLSIMMKALDDNKGSALGLENLSGISETANFYIDVISPNTGLMFNYGDCSEKSATLSPCYFYLAKKFNRPEVSTFYKDLIADATASEMSGSRLAFLSLAWWDNSSDADMTFSNLNTYENEINDVLVLKGNLDTNEKAIYLAAKGGDSDNAHQDLDYGSFVLDKYDLRWFKDHGTNNYSLPSIFTYTPTATRWTYFRNSSLSHNTICIDNKIQYSYGRADIADVDKEKNSAVIDMSDNVYIDLAKTAKRKFTLIDDETIEIEDSIELESGTHSVKWIGSTNAIISINGNVATLTQDGRNLTVTFKVDKGTISLSQEVAKKANSEEYTVTGNMLHATVSASGSVKITATIK